MGCFSYNRLSKNFRLSITCSVDYNQSNPSDSLGSYWVSITFLKVRYFFIADFHFIVDSLRVRFLPIFCKQEKERSRLSGGPHFLNLCSTLYSLISALSWVSWRFSASSKMRDQGSKFSVSSWEDSIPWLETWLPSLSSYFPAPC